MYKFAFVFLIFTAFPHALFGAVTYYKGLLPSDAAEIDVIRENYHRFSPSLQIVAIKRIEEIKFKLADPEYAVREYVNRASIPVTGGGEYGLDVFNAIKYVQQPYISLPMPVRYELREFAVGCKDLASLSPAARAWYTGKIIVNARS